MHPITLEHLLLRLGPTGNAGGGGFEEGLCEGTMPAANWQSYYTTVRLGIANSFAKP